MQKKTLGERLVVLMHYVPKQPSLTAHRHIRHMLKVPLLRTLCWVIHIQVCNMCHLCIERDIRYVLQVPSIWKRWAFQGKRLLLWATPLSVMEL